MSSKLESDVCCRLQVAPSGESYESKRRPGRKQRQTTAGYMAWFTSRHLRADCLYTGISSGPNARDGKTLPFYLYYFFAMFLCVFCSLYRVCTMFLSNRVDVENVFLHTCIIYTSLPAWCHAGTGTRHGPVSVLSQVGVLLKWLNELGWFLAWELPSAYPTLCCREILVPPKIRVLPSGTLRQTLDFKKILPLHIDRRNVLPA